MTARATTAAHRRTARFALDVVDAVSTAVGEERVGFCLSLWLTHYGTFPCHCQALSPNALICTDA
jgi:2,4-dienoyl-CoA reductase-like NADH-dependent reductase (Old Yellow Enzyme family)